MTSYFYIYFLDGKYHYMLIRAAGTVQAVAMARKQAPDALKAGRRWMCFQARRRNMRYGIPVLLSSAELVGTIEN